MVENNKEQGNIEEYNSIMSIDIGTKNFAYSIINDDGIYFDVVSIGDNIYDRERNIRELMMHLILEHNVKDVIIEKQVHYNTVAMCLMYGIFFFSCALLCPEHVFLFRPIDKFAMLGLQVETKQKKHKKAAIMCMRSFIKHKYPKKMNDFNKYRKKDDISDCLM